MRDAGAAVEVIGRSAGQELSGKKGKERARADRGIDQAQPDEYDALLIPGGYSPDNLRADPRFVEFVRAFDRTGRPLAAVCHGPQLLIAAGLVKGRTLTAWRTVQEDLRHIGAQVRDEPVVRDGAWITSRQPDDLDAFSDALVAALRGEEEEEERPAARQAGAGAATGMSAAGEDEAAGLEREAATKEHQERDAEGGPPPSR